MTRMMLAGFAGVFSFAFGGTLLLYMVYQLITRVNVPAEAVSVFGFLSFVLVGLGLLLIVQEAKPETQSSA